MDTHVDEFVKKCRGCILVSAPSAPEPLRRTELPTAPWEHLAIDFQGPLPSGHNLLIVVDYYSRYFEVEVMKKIDATETIKRLERIFARFGLPISVKADNGPQLVCDEIKKYCRTNNIALQNTTPYWPQENGEVERQNRSLLKRLAICQVEKGNWQEDLQKFLLMYRSTAHSVTLKPPAELMFNRNIRDKLPVIERSIDVDGELRDRDAEMKGKGKEYADRRRRAKTNDIKEGDEVVVKRQIITNKLSTAFEPVIHKVIKRSGSEVVVEHSGTGKEYRRNVSHVKKVPSNTNPVLQPSAQPVESSSSSKEPPAPVRTSSRKRSAPSYYHDYELTKRSTKP